MIVFRRPSFFCKGLYLFILESDKNKSTSLPDCSSYPRQLLWTKTEVTGYFYKKTWRHLQCQEPTEDSYRTCLNGKHVILTGDSTTRDWFRYLKKKFDCNLVTQKWTSSKWYKRTSCDSKINKLKIEWVPHAMPFFGDYEFIEIHSISKVLEGIDNKTETVVLIHMYFHLVFYHYSVFKQRMQTISKAVARAIEKNERVTVLIKGPSTCKQLDREYVNDYYGYVYKDIIREAFKDLYDKVVFLDMQEMTTAKRTPDIHPPPDEVREAVHQMLDYVCD